MNDHDAGAATDGGQVTVEIIDAISTVHPAEWNACAHTGPGDPAGPDAGDPRNPFVVHEFLSCLEASGAVSARAGWLPQHLVLRDASGRIAAAMPCYLKSHSQGEYVFDHGWADAFERAGGRYYPKLQCSVPFTPVPGPRLLARPDCHDSRKSLIAAALELCRRHAASSVHWTFLEQPEWDLLANHGMLQRTDQQFHWLNHGYADFDGFLAALTSRKRKTIRRERRAATHAGIAVEWISGTEISEAHWDAFFAFYMDTGSRKWGRPYLNRRFFSLLGEAMADRLLLVMARRNGRYIAGALNLIGGNALYGRYWGCLEDHAFLHFELCYYQAIEFAIGAGLSRVEAGAQGPHKLARGYVPVTTRSAHFIAHPGLRRAVADYLESERAYVAEESQLLAAHAPFRKCTGGDA